MIKAQFKPPAKGHKAAAALRRKPRPLSIRTAQTAVTLAANLPLTIKLKLPRAALGALARGAAESATVTFTATNAKARAPR